MTHAKNGAPDRAAAGPAAPDRSSASTAPEAISPRTMLVSMAVVEVASGVTQQYFSPLLPGIGADAGIGTAAQNWVYVLQQVSMAVLTPLLARLGDMYGYRRVLRLTVVMVTLGSLLMALLPNLAGLATGACLQGGVVGFMPLLIGILRHRTDPARVRRSIGLLVGALLIAIGAGGMISGQVGADDPRTGLWVGVAAGVLGLVACLLLPQGGEPVPGRTFDVRGFALLTVGLVGTVIAIAQGSNWGWTSASTLLTGGLGVVALCLWVLSTRRTAEPIVDLRLFTNPRVVALSTVTVCLSFTTIGTIAVLTTFLAAPAQLTAYGFGLGPSAIGWILLLWVVFGFAGSNLSATVLRRYGDRPATALAGVAGAVGCGGLALVRDSLPGFLACLAATGIASGVYQAVTRTLTVEAVPPSRTATAAGVNELVLSYGSAIGSAVVGVVFASNPLGTTGHVTAGAYTAVWAVCAALCLVATVAALRLPPSSAAERAEEDGAGRALPTVEP